MFKWVWKNKEWLFSGIGVVIVVGTISFFIKKSGNENRLINPPKEVPLSLGQPKEVVLSLLTANKIFSDIEAAPLLQKDDVIKHYMGLHVSWDGQLASAEFQDRKTVLIQIYIPINTLLGVSVFAPIDSTQYPGLSLLKKGHLLHIEGTINKIDEVPTYIQLKNATIKFDL